MEEDIYEYDFKSDVLNRASIKRQIQSLEAAADKAGEVIKYEAAHSPEIQYAIDIVGTLLRTTSIAKSCKAERGITLVATI